MGVVTPIGIGKEAFWDSLKNGRSGVGRLTFFDTTDYPSRSMPKSKASIRKSTSTKRRSGGWTGSRSSPMPRRIWPCVMPAWIQAKIDLDRVGVIVGSGIGGLSTIEEEHDVLRERGARRVSPFLIPKLITNMAPGGNRHPLGIYRSQLCGVERLRHLQSCDRRRSSDAALRRRRCDCRRAEPKPRSRRSGLRVSVRPVRSRPATTLRKKPPVLSIKIATGL